MEVAGSRNHRIDSVAEVPAVQAVEACDRREVVADTEDILVLLAEVGNSEEDIAGVRNVDHLVADEENTPVVVRLGMAVRMSA